MLLLQGRAWGLVPNRGSQEVSSQSQETWLLALALHRLCDLGAVTSPFWVYQFPQLRKKKKVGNRWLPRALPDLTGSL